MKQIRYSVAASLDGYIAGPNGEYDWIPEDPDISFESMYSGYDTIFMGRGSYEVTASEGGAMFGMDTYVFSGTLRQEDCPGVTVVSELEGTVAAIRNKPGKDIWLFGGGKLFGAFANLGFVDSVQIAIMPIILGDGIPLVSVTKEHLKLRLTGHQVFAKTGMVLLDYQVI